MSISDTTTSDSLALVNSFYGPGATACWYLTCLSCFISWTLHPKKKKSDSITSDFIALATFPTVSAAHLISQVQSYPSPELLDDQYARQIHAAMSASLIIVETYLPLCIILLVPTILVRSVKRIILVALTGIFCVAAETYLFFTLPFIRNTTRVFDRSFIVNYVPLLTMVLVLVSVLAAMLFYFIYLTFVRRRLPPRAEPPHGASPEIVRQYRRANRLHDLNRANDQVAWLTVLSLPGLALSFGASTFSIFDDLIWSVTEVRRKLASIRTNVIEEFFPITNTSIMDLDQAVALLAGMTVLGFCLYSAAEERYKIC